MRKIRRIYGTTQETNFISPQSEFSLWWKSFQLSELGGIYQAIFWYEPVKSLNINIICPITKLLALTAKKINIAVEPVQVNSNLLIY
jgi:hypothetical protein